ncbi:hypothetical protein ACIBTV_25565 [Micromonospora sp. NPDC049366]|uniref:hypothetical protein n=1 Tax=Micromonospora sp. NPDC049366 TaxID=3364271 RepID=UPI0037A106E6
MELTQAQQDALLNRAVEAVRSRFAVGPDTDPGEVSRRIEVATLAVTDAVTRGGLLHTQIATLAGVTGLRVIGLISDWSAQGQALGRERHAAARYTDQVREAAASHARQRIGAQGYGARAAIAREVGVTPVTVDAWTKTQPGDV